MSFSNFIKGKYDRRDIIVENGSIPTGSTLFDLIVGGDGYPTGQIVNIIGDSSAGKTFVACEAVYQAKKKYGDQLKVRYNDAESGFNFDTEALYGFDIKEDMVQTPTIQEFSADLGIFCDHLESDEFGIYIVDSFDGLCSDEDIAEFDERKEDYEKGKSYNKGSYDMSKQKYSSKLFRTLAQDLKGKNVLLIVVSQIRDNIGGMGVKWTVSGGKALKFYSSVRLFLKSKEQFLKRERSVGYCAHVQAIKSRSKHPNRSCYVNILFEYGMDNISSDVDFLFDLKDSQGKIDKAKSKAVSWEEGGEEINSTSVKALFEELGVADEFKDMHKTFSMKRALDFIGTDPAYQNAYADKFGSMDRDTLIHYIENNDLADELAVRVRKKWNDIEEEIRPNRVAKRL